MLLFEIISSYSFWFVPLCILGGFLLSFFLYYFKIKESDLSSRLRLLLFFLRGILFGILFFLLLNPLLKRITSEEEKPIVLIAVDNSRSITALKDSGFIKTEFVNRIRKLKDKLSSKFDVKFYRFDSETKQNDTLNFEGKETDYSNLFYEIENNYSNRNLGAVVLASDGLYNRGNNPLYSASKLKAQIFTIALGDTSPVKDNAIKKIDHNQVTYLGNQFPVDVVLSSSKLKGSNVSVSISKGNRKLADQKIKFEDEFQIKTLSFLLDADQPGAQTYLVQMTRTEGELTFENNLQRFVIEVIDNREKILILGNAPHPDMGALKESIESNQNYEVEMALLSDFNKSLKPYSLVFLHSISLSSATKIFNEINTFNLPYFIINAFDLESLPGMKYSGALGKFNEAEPVWNKNFSLFNLSDEFKSFANEFPALRCNLGTYTLNASSAALFQQKIGVVNTENPIFYFAQKGEQKIGVMPTDGLWTWKMRDYAEHENHVIFNELISKTVQYLSVRADKSFFRVYAKKIYKENEVIELDAEVYNESYELITDPEVNLILSNAEGKKFNYTFSKTDRGYKLNLGYLLPGDYSYVANVKIKDKVFQKSGIFSVRQIMIERSNLVADHNLLFQLANSTSGKMVYPNQLDELSDVLENNDSLKTIVYSQKELTDLIDEKWLFAFLVLILTLEWILRKRNGLL